MLEITETKAIITNVVPHVDEETGLRADITLTIEVDGGPKVMKQLHANVLAATCWNEAGEPTVDDFDIRGRHKIENCSVTLHRGAARVFIESADLSHLKFRPTAHHRLEIIVKVLAKVGSKDVAALCDMWVGNEITLSVREKQMSLEDAA